MVSEAYKGVRLLVSSPMIPRVLKTLPPEVRVVLSQISNHNLMASKSDFCTALNNRTEP